MAVKKKFMLVQRRAPYGSNYAQEGLEVALIAAAFEQEITMAFLDDGVFQLQAGQAPGGIGMKRFTAAFGALGDYEVGRVLVERESLVARGLGEGDLMEVGTRLEVVSGEELGGIMAGQDVLLNF